MMLDRKFDLEIEREFRCCGKNVFLQNFLNLFI